MKHTREFKESAIQLILNSNEEIKTIAQLPTYHRTRLAIPCCCDRFILIE